MTDSIRAKDSVSTEPPVDTDVRWVFDTNDFMVVDKPADIPVHPSGRYVQNTLETLLKAARPHSTIHLVSRLDRETSGLVLVAKNPEAAARLAKAPKTKRYEVLVEGDFPEGRICASGAIRRPNLPPVFSKHILAGATLTPQLPPLPENNGAATWFERLGPGPWPHTSLLSAELVTGRTHQIRASLCTLGYPVIGDKIYGRDPTCFLRFIADTLTPEDKALLRLPHQALRAVELSFLGQTFRTVRPRWTAADDWDSAAPTGRCLPF